MGLTSIEWADAVWNPVTGCTKVSPGCSHCYAEAVDHRFDSDKVGKLPWAFPASQGGRGVTLHPDRLNQPLHWRKPRRIFVNSMSDLFHDDIPFEFVGQVLMSMALAPQHIYQVLTKRPARMAGFFQWVQDNKGYTGTKSPSLPRLTINNQWPLPNLWLGVSVENQYWADQRIPILLKIPAAVRFLSCEPLLGHINLRTYLRDSMECNCQNPMGCDCDCGKSCIDWVIAGGESGPGFRPVNTDWLRSIRDECWSDDIPFFLKQGNGLRPGMNRVLDGATWDQIPARGWL